MQEDLLALVKTSLTVVLTIGYSFSSWATCVSHSPNERTHNVCIVSSMNNASLTQKQYDQIVTQLRLSGNMLGDIGLAEYPSFFNFNLRPVVKWDSNANGGNPNKPLTLGGFTFTGDETFNQKPGLLAGLAASISARRVIREGSFIDVNSYITVTQPINYYLTVLEHGYTVCGKIGLVRNFFFDHCYSQNSIEKKIRNSHIYTKKFVLGQVIETTNGAMSVEVVKEIQKSDSLITIKDSAILTNESHNAAAYQVELFNKNPHQTTPSALSSKGVKLSLYANWFDRNSYIVLSHEQFSTQAFLGYPVERTTEGISFGSELITGRHAELSLINQRSNVDYYSGLSYSFALRFSH
jgi:hypothetical protein